MSDGTDKPNEESEDRGPRYLSGHFLISETELVDPNFFRTVVLLIDHTDQGAFGLVVNRPSEVKLGDLIEEIEGLPASEIPVYVGGPVERQYLFMLYSGIDAQVERDHEVEVAPSVMFHPLTVPLVAYLKDTWSLIPEDRRPTVHIFSGYSGWGSGQLETELEHDSWVSLEASADIVFNPNPEEDWRDALSRKSDFYRIVAQTGFKPSKN